MALLEPFRKFDIAFRTAGFDRFLQLIRPF